MLQYYENNIIIHVVLFFMWIQSNTDAKYLVDGVIVYFPSLVVKLKTQDIYIYIN